MVYESPTFAYRHLTKIIAEMSLLIEDFKCRQVTYERGTCNLFAFKIGVTKKEQHILFSVIDKIS